jgi:HEAT repeat protein/MFS family permease
VLTSRLAGRLEVSQDCLPRFLLFLGIGLLQYAANALARTAAEGLFLAKVGAGGLSIYLVVVGLTAVPMAGAMSRLIDRMPKVRLYRLSLVLAVVAALGLRAAATVASSWALYVVLIGAVVIEMLLNIQFWVLISDYFTSIEQKKLIAGLTLAMAAGGILGGGLANGLVRFLPTAELLLVFPVLYVFVVFLLGKLSRTEKPFEAAEGESGETLKESLGSLPKLLAEYPVITLMAVVGFFDVFQGAVGSVLYYTVYTQTFPDEQRLTAFLGTMKAVMCVLQVAIVTFVTRPFISRFGVGAMNVFYPLTTLASIFGLAVRPALPVAVLANVNFDTVSSSLNNPVENLTYNAVPPRFLGRVRSISEGMLQPAGLTVAGIALALAQKSLSFAQIAWIAFGISILHVALGIYRGRKYAHALASQLQSRAIDIAGGEGGRAKIPPEYAEEIDRLLKDGAPESSAFGLELAARLGADRFLPRVGPVLARLEGRGREAGVTFLSAIRGREARTQMRKLLKSGPPQVQALVLEATLRGRLPLDTNELEPLLESADPRVRGLARAALLRHGGATAPLLVRDPELGDDGLGAVARGARAAADRRLVPVLVESMVRGAPGTRATALEGLAAVAPLGEKYAAVVGLVEMELESDDPRARAAAYAILGKEGKERLALVAQGLEDSHSRVRRRAAEALAQAGDDAAPLLVAALASPRSEVVDAALEALGVLRTAAAADAALGYLEADYRQVERNLELRQRLPPDPRWSPLELALDDSNRRVVDKVLRVLAAFGHSRILRHARQALRGRDPRLRANAVEALSSIPHRRFVLPVIGLLEKLAGEGDAASESRVSDGGAAALEFAAVSGERWIRVAALEVLRALDRPLPPWAATDADPVVLATVRSPKEGSPMSRLLFLRRVSLFQNLSLDDLLALDGALRRVDFLPDETIFEEGSVGEDFYIISEGEVSVRTDSAGVQVERARLGSGDFFGEMALFDDEPRSATCVAAVSCTLLVLDRGRFYGLIEQMPQLGLAICKTLSQRLRRTERDLRAAHTAKTA